MFPQKCAGGKGNRGMFIERDPKVCAAGVPSAQEEHKLSDCLKQYSLQDEVDALVHDAIEPPPKPRILPPLRRQPPADMRNAGIYNEASYLINPPGKTKFQTLVDDFKDTIYTSYWNKRIGSVRDPVPTLPAGLDTVRTTFGKPTPDCGRLYDVVMPKIPVPEKTPVAKLPGQQTDRKYCRPSYNPDIIFGQKTRSDVRGRLMKCSLTDDRVPLGTLNKPIPSSQADFKFRTLAQLGLPLAPNNNISNVKQGHAFGKLKPPDNLPECLTTCEMNPSRDHFKKCISHLNTLRKCLKKRVDGTFFKGVYLDLKYYDTDKSGWLNKELVYKYCNRKYVRFDPLLLEPLLSTWNAFNGYQIEYNTFVNMLNHTMPCPELPKVWDVPDECIDFRTTYSEMIKPGQCIDRQEMAGLPSGRYFDLDRPITPAGLCRADITYLPHESDAKSCLCPSVLTNFGISHRDMYANRSPADIRKVYEAALKEKFSDEQFDVIWQKAKTYHSQGWVCYETFRRALEELDKEIHT